MSVAGRRILIYVSCMRHTRLESPSASASELPRVYMVGVEAEDPSLMALVAMGGRRTWRGKAAGILGLVG